MWLGSRVAVTVASASSCRPQTLESPYATGAALKRKKKKKKKEEDISPNIDFCVPPLPEEWIMEKSGL